jgi:hypothetical protein
VQSLTTAFGFFKKSDGHKVAIAFNARRLDEDSAHSLAEKQALNIVAEQAAITPESSVRLKLFKAPSVIATIAFLWFFPAAKALIPCSGIRYKLGVGTLAAKACSATIFSACFSAKEWVLSSSNRRALKAIATLCPSDFLKKPNAVVKCFCCWKKP